MAMAESNDLDPWFAAARTRPPVPDTGFLARLEADIPGAMPLPPPRPAARRAAPRRSVGWGGWSAAAGLAAAAVTGLWIGIAVPEAAPEFSPLSGEAVDLLALADGSFDEG